MTYGSDFYEGYSCLTVNEYGKGKAWYVAADADKEFYGDFLEKVLKDSGVSCGIKEEIPDALEITVRENENEKYYIYQNFRNRSCKHSRTGRRDQLDLWQWQR